MLARVDLVPRTPRFREDQFRDLFGPESPSPVTEPLTQPAPTPASPRDTREHAPAPRDTTAKRDSDARHHQRQRHACHGFVPP